MLISSTRSSRRFGNVPKRTLWVACMAHALHDGYSDLIYVMLPVWQAEFGLSYATLAILRSLYVGAMAILQLPAGRLYAQFGGRAVLVSGTILAAAGWALAGGHGSLLGALIISGAGASTQHPIASGAVSRAYGSNARGPLGIYNFAGDLGKAAVPAIASLLLGFLPWQSTLLGISGIGFAAAVVIWLYMPAIGHSSKVKSAYHSKGRGGFPMLLLIGVLDSAVRMGVLTCLPFLLKENGAPQAVIGLALTLVFIGGAGGKFACGWLSVRIGLPWTVTVTKVGTAVGIVAVLVSPLAVCLIVLPLLGICLNGTSSALYGTIPDLSSTENIERAFALFYTATIGSGAVAPILYGALGDNLGIGGATLATAITALTMCPLAFGLARHLAPRP